MENVVTNQLSKVASGPLSVEPRDLTVGDLERLLLLEFPAQDAEPWDRTGLLVGDPSQKVTRVVCALDATVAAVRDAAAAGANVLLTHHPVFIDAPDDFKPAAPGALHSGAVVYEAIAQGVALVNFHTALDVSPAAARVLPGMLGLDFAGQVAEIGNGEGAKAKRIGYGQICTVRPDDAPMTLRALAARATSVFGRAPRVWGNMDAALRTVVTCTGSASSTAPFALQAGAQCIVCGEIKYHAALDLSAAGLAIIELGHDVSELPLAAVLAQAAGRVGVPSENIVVLDQGQNWGYPESVRI